MQLRGKAQDSRMDAIVVSGELTETTDIDSWSWAELLVVVGWLSGLITCCLALRNLCKCCWGPQDPRKPRSREMAGSQTVSRGVEASTQTILCTPPDSLTQRDKEKGNRAVTPDPIAVYSSYRRGGNRERLTQDMVVRALPVLSDMEQRIDMARMRESCRKS